HRAREQKRCRRGERHAEGENGRRAHSPAGYGTQPRARHAGVYVPVQVHVHRVGAAGHQVAADRHDQHQPPRWRARHEHRRNCSNEQQGDDAWLGKHHQVAEQRCALGFSHCHSHYAPSGRFSAEAWPLAAVKERLDAPLDPASGTGRIVAGTSAAVGATGTGCEETLGSTIGCSLASGTTSLQVTPAGGCTARPVRNRTSTSPTAGSQAQSASSARWGPEDASEGAVPALRAAGTARSVEWSIAICPTIARTAAIQNSAFGSVADMARKIMCDVPLGGRQAGVWN